MCISAPNSPKIGRGIRVLRCLSGLIRRYFYRTFFVLCLREAGSCFPWPGRLEVVRPCLTSWQFCEGKQVLHLSPLLLYIFAYCVLFLWSICLLLLMERCMSRTRVMLLSSGNACCTNARPINNVNIVIGVTNSLRGGTWLATLRSSGTVGRDGVRIARAPVVLPGDVRGKGRDSGPLQVHSAAAAVRH